MLNYKKLNIILYYIKKTKCVLRFIFISTNNTACKLTLILL